MLIDNPAPQNSGFEALKLKSLVRWRSPSVIQKKKKTILITVLKQHQRLANLVECLKHRAVNLHGKPCLVIDDEADQAGLQQLRLQEPEDESE